MSFFGGGLMQGMAGGLQGATNMAQQKRLRDMMIGPTATPNPLPMQMETEPGDYPMGMQASPQTMGATSPNLMQQLMRMFGG